jgi:hypothetical protein
VKSARASVAASEKKSAQDPKDEAENQNAQSEEESEDLDDD